MPHVTGTRNLRTEFRGYGWKIRRKSCGVNRRGSPGTALEQQALVDAGNQGGQHGQPFPGKGAQPRRPQTNVPPAPGPALVPELRRSVRLADPPRSPPVGLRTYSRPRSKTQDQRQSLKHQGTLLRWVLPRLRAPHAGPVLTGSPPQGTDRGVGTIDSDDDLLRRCRWDEDSVCQSPIAAAHCAAGQGTGTFDPAQPPEELLN